MPEIEIVAIADPDEAGRTRAQERSGASRAYGDYRELLVNEQVDLVAIAPRWVGQRVAMAEAATAAGAHLFFEKPLAGNLADADAILAAGERAGRKIAVAHQGRLHPATLHAKQLIETGKIGRPRLIRAYGKMDRRGGGQDLAILGTHVLDAVGFLAGRPAWASAELLAGSRLAEASDFRPGDEEIGPIAGDGLRATYGMPNGVVATFESFANLGANEDLFGLEIAGESGQLSLRGGLTKRLLFYPRPYILPGAADDRWEPIDVPGAQPGEVPGDHALSQEELFQRGNQRLVLDLLAAIEEDREPAASGAEARNALEMIQAIAVAHAHGGRIAFPLVQRTHPFAEEAKGEA
jgi:predicted dehydrogenase